MFSLVLLNLGGYYVDCASFIEVSSLVCMLPGLDFDVSL